MKAPFTENSFVASYSDTVFRREIIEKILAVDGDVVFCIDSLWKERYELRSEEDIRAAETLEITGQQVEFTGLIVFKSAAVKRITTLSESEVGTSMLDLIDYLGKTELSDVRLSHEHHNFEWLDYEKAINYYQLALSLDNTFQEAKDGLGNSYVERAENSIQNQNFKSACEDIDNALTYNNQKADSLSIKYCQ